jgi:hypothetical protein
MAEPWDDAVDAAARLFDWTPEQVEAERHRQADRWTLADLDDELVDDVEPRGALTFGPEQSAAMRQALEHRQEAIVDEMLRMLGEDPE